MLSGLVNTSAVMSSMVNKQQEVFNSISRLLDLWLPHRMEYEEIPGLSLGIVFKGELVAQKGYGFANKEKKGRATPATNYRIASISKMFTAVAILQLAEKRKLRLSDPVSKHLPWFEVKRRGANSDKITLRQLLSHASGVFRDAENPQWETNRFPTLKQLQNLISEHTLTFPAGREFKYSNFGFALLGQVIEKVAGTSYEEYVEKHIFKPLRMNHSSTDLPDSVSGLASGYGRYIPGKKAERFSQIQTNAFASATGVTSNVKDLSRFFGSLFTADTRILKAASKKEMFLGRMKTGEGSYGLGIEILHKSGQTLLGHGGGFQGFTSGILFNRGLGLGTIILTNVVGASVGDMATTIHGLYKVISKEAEKPGRTPNLKRFEGYYRGRWGDLAIVQAGKRLIVQTPYAKGGAGPSILSQVKGNEFRIDKTRRFDSIGERATFKREKGKDVLWWGNDHAYWNIKD